MPPYAPSQYSSMHPIYLYDLRGGPAQPWAPNIWRIRFIINYKRLPVKTVFLDFHEVEPQLRAMGAPPATYRHDHTPVYTLPVIVDSNTHAHGSRQPTIISNINHIAEYLEATYPARPVFPDGSRAMQTLFVHWIQDTMIQPLLPIMLTMSHPNFRTMMHEMSANGMSRGYSPGTPASSVNGGAVTPLSGPQWDEAWRQVKAQFDFLGTVLEKNASDPESTVAQGRELTYADFTICSILLWIKRVASREGWPQVKMWGKGRWERLYERCREYMDDDR